MDAWKAAAGAIGIVGVWEAAWWARRRHERSRVFALARQRAVQLGRPLVVVGAPDGGVTSGYGCGDLVVDLHTSAVCPRSIAADITRPLPLADDSAVVFVSCVLEYVGDKDAAMRELERVSGGNLYIVRVEPWTLAAYLYPGARRTVSPREGMQT